MLTGKQEHLITVALRAAEKHGLALGGNAALAAHGLPGFSAKQIDLVTTRDKIRDIDKAAKAVEKELRREGYAPERADTKPELRRMQPPAPDMLARWHVPTGGGHDHPPIGGLTRYKCPQCWERLYLELSRAPRIQQPVRAAVGPVLHAEDAAGSRVRELADRGLVRDYADTARLLERWSPRQLAGFARRIDPGLDPRDINRAAARLATLPDIALTGLGAVRPEQLTRMREQFANWQRDPRDAVRPEAGRQRERPEPAREARYRPTGKGLTWIREQGEAERGEPQRQQPVPTIQPRAEPARQALPPQREAERDEPERTR